MSSTSQLNIKNPRARQLALELSRVTGETVTEAVMNALDERLQRQTALPRGEGLAERLMEIGRHAASLPVLDPREPDEMLYDEYGLPK
jgi:antitoxin VapB